MVQEYLDGSYSQESDNEQAANEVENSSNEESDIEADESTIAIDMMVISPEKILPKILENS